MKHIRTAVARLLDWEDAHAGFEKVVGGLPPQLCGKVPPGLPYSPWQLLEHLRIAQEDILQFCIDPDYQVQVARRLLARKSRPAICRSLGSERSSLS